MTSRRMPGVLALLLAIAPAAAAQTPPAQATVALDWDNLRLVIAPDSGATYFWVNSGKVAQGGQGFAARFNPDSLSAWIADARAFLRQTPDAGDTAKARTSAPLLGSFGGSMHLLRRRDRRGWSQERLLVMAPPREKPLIINGNDENIGQILDSLEAVSRRTPRPALATEAGPPKSMKRATGKSSNRPPAYPSFERQQDREGVVLVSFVVDVDGKADMNTVAVVHSSGSGFLESVMKSLSGFRFNPGEVDGKPVRERVVMPFNFRLYRK